MLRSSGRAPQSASAGVALAAPVRGKARPRSFREQCAAALSLGEPRGEAEGVGALPDLLPKLFIDRQRYARHGVTFEGVATGGSLPPFPR